MRVCASCGGECVCADVKFIKISAIIAAKSANVGYCPATRPCPCLRLRIHPYFACCCLAAFSFLLRFPLVKYEMKGLGEAQDEKLKRRNSAMYPGYRDPEREHLVSRSHIQECCSMWRE